ncbi:MAG: 16S rRNA (uracil(1498)-N(3))-methyltransferase [Dongiaceae bacterium]
MTLRDDAAGTKPATRLHVEADLAAGRSLGLDPMRAHYLRHVLRLAPGERVALFNGRDGEWLARIDGFGKGWCSLSIETRRRPQGADRDLWLVFAPIKRARLDFLAEKATELGVAALAPVFTRRTAVARVNTDRLRANAVEAAQQCGRLSVPQVFEPVALADLVARWPADRRLLLCAEAGPARPIAEALTELAGGPAAAAPWAVMTGPEGGFAPSELDDLGKLPFVTPVGLGPRLLRADTAALAALACWQAILGDGRARPTGPEDAAS